jgi:sulfate permease, SulP family
LLRSIAPPPGPAEAATDERGVRMTAAATRRVRAGLPVLQGLLPIDGRRVPLEVAAGATLGALAIPETMGYASMAGMPPVTGLYTLLIPILVFALLGSSRHLVVGADSATAVVLYAGIAGLGVAVASPEWVALAGMTALMVGVILFAARLLGLGFLANFLSRSVLIGFMTGVGIQVAMGQLHGVLGVSDGSGTTIEKFVTTLRNIPQAIPADVAIWIFVWAVILGGERINKRIPGALIAVIVTIVIGYAGLYPSAVTLLGTVPAGLPPFGLPQDVISTTNFAALLPTALSCFIIILAQSAATSQAYAAKYEDSFDENVDLIGLAAANLGAGLSGTFVVNGSPTKTQMVDGAGGRTQLSQLVAGAIVLAVLIFLTPALQYMPNAVLAAVVLLIGLKLVDIKGMQGVLNVRRGEFVVALITAATVVVVGIEQAVILAIVLSIVEHLTHAYRPFDTTLAVSADGKLEAERVSVTGGTILQARPGLVIYRFGAGLYYANATRFLAEVNAILEEADPPIQWFCVSGAAIPDVDYSGASAIRQVIDQVKSRGAKFVVCEAEPGVVTRDGQWGLAAEADAVYDFIDEVIAAYDGGSPGTSAPTTTGSAPVPPLETAENTGTA